MAAPVELSSKESFGGQQKFYSHFSESCKCTMTFSVYVPPAVTQGTVSKVPVLYFLGGLTTTVQLNVFMGYQYYAAEHSLVVVSPDTSPRDTGLPGENDADPMYGHSAGFYIDATTPGWKDHYKMFTYVTEELISVVETNFDYAIAGRRGMTGMSMGGMGALLCGLKRSDLYQSLSSIFPLTSMSSIYDDQGVALLSELIPAPGVTGDRKKTLELYLGTDEEVWKEWDIYELLKSYKGRPLDIVVHTAACDRLWDLLKQWKLIEGARGKDNINLRLKLLAVYGHDLDFIVKIMAEVIQHHANILNK